MNTKTVKENFNFRKHFEANMLDGADVYDCGKSMISAEEVWEYIAEFIVPMFYNQETSFTCCNIEVSEPKGTEVHCTSCGEWCETK